MSITGLSDMDNGSAESSFLYLIHHLLILKNYFWVVLYTLILQFQTVALTLETIFLYIQPSITPDITAKYFTVREVMLLSRIIK